MNRFRNFSAHYSPWIFGITLAFYLFYTVRGTDSPAHTWTVVAIYLIGFLAATITAATARRIRLALISGVMVLLSLPAMVWVTYLLEWAQTRR